MSGSVDRLTAARLLVRVEEGAFASRLLEQVRAPGIRTRVLGVLRWQSALDAVIQARCHRSLGRMDAEVRAALRGAVFEARFLGVPAPVATDSAVHLVRRLGKSSAAGLVNAVVRRAIRDWDEVLERLPEHVRLAHPEWLLTRWQSLFGRERSEAMAAADQAPAPLWVWFPGGAPEGELEPHPWCPGAWTSSDAGSVLARAVSCGEARAQDPASQLVAHVAARLAAGHGSPSLVDLCAAPGGKSLLMASLVTWRLHLAVEVQPQRARRLAAAVSGPRVGAAVVCADGGSPPLRSGAWDVVVVDAPCSGTGTLRRHPELKWRLRQEILAELARGQQRLIRRAVSLLAPRGVLLYATCSVEPEENEDHFARLPSGFEIRSLEPHLPRGVPALPTGSGGVRLLPSADSDGFTLHAVGRLGSTLQSGP